LGENHANGVASLYTYCKTALANYFRIST